MSEYYQKALEKLRGQLAQEVENIYASSKAEGLPMQAVSPNVIQVELLSLLLSEALSAEYLENNPQSDAHTVRKNIAAALRELVINCRRPPPAGSVQ